MKKLHILLTLLVLGSIPSCTDNKMAKSFGGTATVDLPKNTKFVTATWKDTQLWYVFRPMRENEKPETFTLQEQSSLGILEGRVIFNEHN